MFHHEFGSRDALVVGREHRQQRVSHRHIDNDLLVVPIVCQSASWSTGSGKVG